jgi:hypothetical protein
MRLPRCAITASILSAFCFAGCGGGEDTTTVPMKTTDTSQFKGMIEQQSKDLKATKSGAPIKQ